jgi:acyl dehydratase
VTACRTWGRTITEADLVLYSMLTQDWAELHVNHEAVRRTRFERPIAHAGLTLAIATGLTAGAAGDLVPYGMEDIRFVRPAFLGDTLYVELDDEPQPGTTTPVRILNERAEELVVTSVSFAEPGAGAPPRSDAGPDSAAEPAAAELTEPFASRFLDDVAVGDRFVSTTRRLVRADTIETFLDLSGDPQGVFGTVLCRSETLGAGRFDRERRDVAPGLLLLGQHWGITQRRGPLRGIVATYRLEDVAHLGPLRPGDWYRTEIEVVSVDDLGDGLGRVRTRRRVVGDDGRCSLSLVERARWQTRERWESAQAGAGAAT